MSMITKGSRLLLGILMFPALAACSTISTSVVRAVPQGLPQQRIYSYGATNQCLSRIIAQTLETRNEKILFLIGSLGDRTKNDADWTSGPISAAGSLMLEAQLSTYGGPRVILQGVRSNEVRNLEQIGQEFSVADIIKLQRQYGVDRIFLITGGVSGFDQARGSGGEAASTQYRDNKTEIGGGTGRAFEAAQIDVILKISDVVTNRLLATISLSGTDRRRSAETKFTLEIRGVGGGFASQNVQVDGTHNVQASIMAAAHFYLWQAILSGDEETKCLYDPAFSPSVFAASINSYEAATKEGKVRLLQKALNAFFSTKRTPLATDGLMGPATLATVRAAEEALRLAPAARGDFGTLYAHLLQKGAAR